MACSTEIPAAQRHRSQQHQGDQGAEYGQQQRDCARACRTERSEYAVWVAQALRIDVEPLAHDLRQTRDQRAADCDQRRAAADHGGEIGEFARTRHLAALARVLQAFLRRFFGFFTARFGFGSHQRTPAAGARTRSATAAARC
jgi:hypothetical protein